MARGSDPAGGRRRRRWLVDGMNLIGSRPDGWWNDPDRAVHRLIDSLARFASRTGDEVTVVFDRRPRDLQPGPRAGIEVAFARRRGRNAADHEIIRMVSEDGRPWDLNVVTSDDWLADRVRDLEAPVTPSGRFRRDLERISG